MGRKKQTYRITPRLEEEIENLLPGQVLVIDCQSALEAKELTAELKAYLFSKTTEGVLPFSYDVVYRDILRSHQVIIRCHERPRIRIFEKDPDGKLKEVKEGRL